MVVEPNKLTINYFCSFIQLTSPFFSIICINFSGKAANLYSFLFKFTTPLLKSTLTLSSALYASTTSGKTSNNNP